jgi:hypothetical protein
MYSRERKTVRLYNKDFIYLFIYVLTEQTIVQLQIQHNINRQQEITVSEMPNKKRKRKNKALR